MTKKKPDTDGTGAGAEAQKPTGAPAAATTAPADLAKAPAPPERIAEAVVVCPSCSHAATIRLDDVFPVKVKEKRD